MADRFATSTTGAPPTDEQRRHSEDLRQRVIIAAAAVEELPDSRWKSLALTSFEEALMWANKAIFNP